LPSALHSLSLKQVVVQVVVQVAEPVVVLAQVLVAEPVVPVLGVPVVAQVQVVVGRRSPRTHPEALPT
jgi:hypothetical protein